MWVTVQSGWKDPKRRENIPVVKFPQIKPDKIFICILCEYSLLMGCTCTLQREKTLSFQKRHFYAPDKITPLLCSRQNNATLHLSYSLLQSAVLNKDGSFFRWAFWEKGKLRKSLCFFLPTLFCPWDSHTLTSLWCSMLYNTSPHTLLITPYKFSTYLQRSPCFMTLKYECWIHAKSAEWEEQDKNPLISTWVCSGIIQNVLSSSANLVVTPDK